MMKVITTTDGAIPDLSNPGYLGSNPDGDREVMAVLSQDDAGLYAVYVGIIDGRADRLRSAGRVMHNGRKLSYEKAKFFFSNLEEAEYRR